MFTEEISQLANVLHNSGDKILNGSSKLCVNAALLQKISCDFNQLCQSRENSPSFDVLATHASLQGPVLTDLQFLHDFFQKVIGLRIINTINLNLHDNKIDLSKFKSIKYLELKSVPVKNLMGLKSVRSQVECIVYSKGLSSLEELLAECGADKSTGFVWGELREAVLSFNWLRKVDTSVALAPWLQVLDLSHNYIEDVKPLECLPNLKYVNLSFNKLVTIPMFNKSARKKMDVLVLKNNFIEHLDGLFGLDYLVELDLSNNFICSSDFKPFLTMSTLRHLSFEGNPVYLLPNYRKIIVGYLHISASFGNFVLDGRSLTKQERDLVGIEVMLSRLTVDSNQPNLIFEPPIEPRTQKKVLKNRTRLVAIPNISDGTYEGVPPDVDNSNAYNLNDNMIDPLETKRLLESARKTFGDNWLRCEAAGVVQNILGLPQTGHLASTPYDDSCLKSMLDTITPIENTNAASTITITNNLVTTKAVIEKLPEKRTEEFSKANTADSFLSCIEENASTYYSLNSTENDEQIQQQQDFKEQSPDIETIQEPVDAEHPEKLYLAVKLKKLENTGEVVREEIFLSFTKTEVREKDVENGKTIMSWSHGALESGTRCKNEVHLVFSTVRKDRRERIYELESSDAQEVLEICRRILEQRSLIDMNQVVFICMNCASQFTVEKDHRQKDIAKKCPICKSQMVLETDEVPAPKSGETKNSKKTHHRSFSVGLVDSTVQQDLIKCSSQSSIGSATSFDEPHSLTPTPMQPPKRCESDIEILSNPSQSSIEVIDAPRGTPRRKHSVEVKPQLPAFSNLTESSSSGSVTDSICTAYENPSMASSALSKKSECVVIEETGYEELIKYPKSFEHMLKEVLDQVGSKVSKYQGHDNKCDIDKDFIKYSYTDYSQLDHRMKLFIYAQLFEDNLEDFLFLIRCQLLQGNSENSFEACVVASNKKLYILKVNGIERGEDISKFLTKIDVIKGKGFWKVLPWYQGFSFSLSNDSQDYIILLKDPERTKSLQAFLSLAEVFPECHSLNDKPSDDTLRITQLLLSFCEEPSLQLVTLLVSCTIYRDRVEICNVGESAIIVSKSNLLLMRTIAWLFKPQLVIPKPTDEQKVSDLLQSSLRGRELSLQFLNESEGVQHVWKIILMTEHVAETLLSSIRDPWEELFSVPLHVSQDNLL